MVSAAVSLTVNITTQLIGPWVRDFGGSGADNGQSVAVEKSTGNIIVAGYFSGSADFGGALNSAGGVDIFLAKYSSSGLYQWSKRIGGTGNEIPSSGRRFKRQYLYDRIFRR
jgi:hypothetical protein